MGTESPALATVSHLNGGNESSYLLAVVDGVGHHTGCGKNLSSPHTLQELVEVLEDQLLHSILAYWPTEGEHLPPFLSSERNVTPGGGSPATNQ